MNERKVENRMRGDNENLGSKVENTLGKKKTRRIDKKGEER